MKKQKSPDEIIPFPDYALYHTKMITGASALLSAVEPDELSKEDYSCSQEFMIFVLG